MTYKILITGCAGFIGAATAKKLLDQGHSVLGIDNLNHYYDVNLKLARLELLKIAKNFNFQQLDIKELSPLQEIFQHYKPQRVIHLAAQAGVRYSLENPQVYIDSNLVGFANLLQVCQQLAIEHLVYASSSSVYGNDTPQPFNTTAATDKPVSLYAATKKANEILAYSYSHLYQIPMTGLRYFTVYGPWGRPDMAPIKFAKQLLSKQPIGVFNHGHHKRDFTYVDDIVNGTVAVMQHIPSGAVPHQLYNIASGRPINLMDFIQQLAQQLGQTPVLEFLPKQAGDVDETWADISLLTADVGYQPQTSFAEGIEKFVNWFRDYYNS